MPKNRVRPPRALLIIAAVLVLVGLIASPLLQALVPAQVLSGAVLLQGIPFLVIFVAILLTFIYSIFWLASRLNNVISERTHTLIERIIILGIVIGVVTMFQPFTMFAYQNGFLLLLIATLAFTAWSHVTPRTATHNEMSETGPATVEEIETSAARS